MSKVFDIDFRKGTLIDSSEGYVGTQGGSGVSFIKKEKGLAISTETDADYLSFSTTLTTLNPETDPFVIVLAFQIKKVPPSGFQSFLQTGAGSVVQNGFNFYYYNGTLYFRVSDGVSADSTSAAFSSIPKNEWCLAIIEYGESIKYTIYDSNCNIVLNPSTTALRFGNEIGQSVAIQIGAIADMYYSFLRIYFDKVLTSNERAKLCREFLRATPTSKIIE